MKLINPKQCHTTHHYQIQNLRLKRVKGLQALNQNKAKNSHSIQAVSNTNSIDYIGK